MWLPGSLRWSSAVFPAQFPIGYAYEFWMWAEVTESPVATTTTGLEGLRSFGQTRSLCACSSLVASSSSTLPGTGGHAGALGLVDGCWLDGCDDGGPLGVWVRLGSGLGLAVGSGGHGSVLGDALGGIVACTAADTLVAVGKA